MVLPMPRDTGIGKGHRGCALILIRLTGRHRDLPLQNTMILKMPGGLIFLTEQSLPLRQKEYPSRCTLCLCGELCFLLLTTRGARHGGHREVMILPMPRDTGIGKELNG